METVIREMHSGKKMRTNVVANFAQRALFLYVAEAAVVLAIIMITRAHV
jgi:hypothetical protein